MLVLESKKNLDDEQLDWLKTANDQDFGKHQLYYSGDSQGSWVINSWPRLGNCENHDVLTCRVA